MLWSLYSQDLVFRSFTMEVALSWTSLLRRVHNPEPSKIQKLMGLLTFLIPSFLHLLRQLGSLGVSYSWQCHIINSQRISCQINAQSFSSDFFLNQGSSPIFAPLVFLTCLQNSTPTFLQMSFVHVGSQFQPVKIILNLSSVIQPINDPVPLCIIWTCDKLDTYIFI